MDSMLSTRVMHMLTSISRAPCDSANDYISVAVQKVETSAKNDLALQGVMFWLYQVLAVPCSHHQYYPLSRSDA